MRKKNAIEPEKPKQTRRRSPQGRTQKIEFREFYETHDTLCNYTISLLHDGANRFNFTKSADSLRKDIATVKNRCASEGLSFLTIVLPSLFSSLLTYLETGISDYPGFKKTSGREYPAFLQQYFAQIYDEKLCETDRAMYIDFVYQVCVAFKKLKGPYRKSVLRKQLADFVETDIELRYLNFRSDADMSVILDSAVEFVTSIFKNVDVDEEKTVTPRPGPGATNTPVEKHLRFRPHVLYTQLNDEFPYEEWFYSHPWDLVTETHKHPFKLQKRDVPTSRFKFVPKTFSKPRGICIEQLETMYLQQALCNMLVKTLERHPVTSGHINFKDQSINGGLALESSHSKKFATIDMKEASDRIARKLVRILFKNLDDLRNKLIALSTTVIELPDDINFVTDFPTAKYAPMGSALCFPIMSLVHYALIRGICQHTGHHSCIDSIYVYGDDIIVPVECVEAVYTHLPKFGMKLNVTKSFYKSSFRESCGVHAYNGKNITPTYFKYVPNINMNLEAFVSLLHTERLLYKNNYRVTASLLRRELREKNTWGFPLPTVTPDSVIPGFIRDDLKFVSFKSFSKLVGYKYNKRLQCWKARFKVISACQEELPPIAPDEGLLRWHLTGAEMEVAKQPLGKRDQVISPGQLAGHVKGSTLRLKCVVKNLSEPALNGERDISICAFSGLKYPSVWYEMYRWAIGG